MVFFAARPKSAVSGVVAQSASVDDYAKISSRSFVVVNSGEVSVVFEIIPCSPYGKIEIVVVFGYMRTDARIYKHGRNRSAHYIVAH